MQTAAAGAGALALGGTAQAESSPSPTGILKPGATILFQGDSITDAKRDRKVNQANQFSALGNGYAMLAAAGLLTDRPDAGYQIHNRGISGNKVYQLAKRWDQDCLALKPDVLSILIGVNDIWHWLNGKYNGTVEVYRQDYDALLTRTREALPEVKLVICEPFVLKTGAVDDKWFPKFDEFRAAAKEIAEQHADVWVPFQTQFDRALAMAPPSHWAGDGVHPSSHGAALMAHAWRQAVDAA